MVIPEGWKLKTLEDVGKWRGGGTPSKAVAEYWQNVDIPLTRVDPRSLNEALEALSTLHDAGVPAFHAFVRAYKSHERAALEGVAIGKYKGANACEGGSDYVRVLDEVLRDW